jgi:hypothetical protein
VQLVAEAAAAGLGGHSVHGQRGGNESTGRKDPSWKDMGGHEGRSVEERVKRVS